MNPPASTVTQRAAAIKEAMVEVAKCYAQQKVTDALRQRNGPYTDPIHNTPIGSKVLVWRTHLAKWTGPFKLLSIQGETCNIDMPHGPANCQTASVKPYLQQENDEFDPANNNNNEDNENHDNPATDNNQPQWNPTSETADNHAGVGPSTIPVIDTPETANGSNGEAVKAGNSNDTNNNVEAATAHNQEVIDRQRQQIRCVRQEIKYKENKQELKRLNARRQEGAKAATTNSENNRGFTPGPQEPRPYAGGPKGSRHRLQEYLDEINQSRELMPEQFPTEWDFIVWAGTYLEKTAMSDWRRQKEQHNHAWVTYDNYLKVFKQNLSPGEDTDEQNIVAFNAAEPNANNTMTSWYKKLYRLYCFLLDTYKQMGEAPT
ncbi:hypothetical protein LPUS_04446 [Lasallia pustulata]|uniref:Uncharacterized protein n=1 Tax=Lasallia pustulata TaxID=136370 RepID=A0A1W5CWN4_9LECA|nr:hypothetical protein LPUS_04446 [Lasallia pustulata]